MIKPTWRQSSSAIAASLFSFYNLILFSLPNVLGIYLLRDLSLSPLQLSFLSSWDLWGNVLGFIPIGILYDRYNSRAIAVILLSLAIISTTIMAYANSLWLFCLLRFFQGLASCGSLLLIMRMGTTLFPRSPNKAIGWMIFIALSGGIVGNSLFSHLATHLGWRNGLLCITAIGMFCFLTMIIGLRKENSLKIHQFGFHQILNKHAFFAGWHLGLLNAPVFVLAGLFGNYYLISQMHISLDQAASLSSLLFLGIICGSPLVGYLADKVGSFWVLLGSYTILILSSLALFINPGFSYYSFLSLFFIFGLASCTQNLIYPLLYKNYTHSYSTTIGTSSLISNGIGALLQILFGLLLQFYNTNKIFIFFTALFFVGLINLKFFSQFCEKNHRIFYGDFKLKFNK